MKIKYKFLLTTNIIFFISCFIFIILIKFFSKKFYIYENKKILYKIEKNIKKNSNYKINHNILIGIINLKNINENNFNSQIQNSLFKKNSWKYNLWFNKKDLSNLKNGKSVTKIFYQNILKSSFLVRVFGKDNSIYVIAISIPSIENSLNLIFKFSIIIFISITIIYLVLFSYFFKNLSKKIKSIEENIDFISNKEFKKVKSIYSKDEIQLISEKLLFLSKELERYIRILKRKNQNQKYFFDSLSHELKTSMSVVIGYIYYIENDLSEESKHYSSIMLSECNRISNMASKFKELSINPTKFDKKKISIDEILKEVLNRYSLDFKTKNINIQLDIQNIYFYGDKELIKVVFDNLISNAITYTKGLIKIKLFSNKDNIIFEIFNSGDNIKNENLKKIWQPFYRENNLIKGKYGNYGLGLSIVLLILQEHSGVITVDNLKNGVLFKISLPKL